MKYSAKTSCGFLIDLVPLLEQKANNWKRHTILKEGVIQQVPIIELSAWKTPPTSFAPDLTTITVYMYLTTNLQTIAYL